MAKNNYDMSSTGLSVEVNVFHDSWLSQEFFKEAMTNLQGDTYIYGYDIDLTDMNFGDFFDLSFEGVPNRTLAKIIQWEWTGYHFRGFQRDDYINVILDEFCFPRDFKDFVEFCEAVDLPLPRKFERYVTRGHCQGDVAEVFYFGEPSKELHEDIDHICWDSPIYCHITVNDEEFRPMDTAESIYEWDRDWVISQTVSHFGNEDLQGILEELVPEYPEYL